MFFPYADALEPLGRWMVQLTAESLGKADPTGTGRRSASGVGSTPIPARGTTDQHSQVQLYTEGPNDKIFTLIQVENFRTKCAIPASFRAIPELAYLTGHDMGELLNVELEATEFEDRAGGARSLVRWTLASEPRLMLRLAAPVMQQVLERVLDRALTRLEAVLAEGPAQSTRSSSTEASPGSPTRRGKP